MFKRSGFDPGEGQAHNLGQHVQRPSLFGRVRGGSDEGEGPRLVSREPRRARAVLAPGRVEGEADARRLEIRGACYDNVFIRRRADQERPPAREKPPRIRLEKVRPLSRGRSGEALRARGP